MSEEADQGGRRGQGAARRARLAAALRENLRRRKAQARGQAEALARSSATGDGANDETAGGAPRAAGRKTKGTSD
jgi:hypothetical protein